MPLNLAGMDGSRADLAFFYSIDPSWPRFSNLLDAPIHLFPVTATKAAAP